MRQAVSGFRVPPLARIVHSVPASPRTPRPATTPSIFRQTYGGNPLRAGPESTAPGRMSNNRRHARRMPG